MPALLFIKILYNVTDEFEFYKIKFESGLSF